MLHVQYQQSLNVLKKLNAQRLSNAKRKKIAKKSVTRSATKNATRNVIKSKNATRNKIAIKSKNVKKLVKNNYHFINNEKGAAMMLFPFFVFVDMFYELIFGIVTKNSSIGIEYF